MKRLLLALFLTLAVVVPASAQCIRQQSTSTYHFIFLMIDSTDHVTGKTGLSPTVYLSKNAGSGVSASGAITQIDSTNLPGLYKLAGNTTDTNTLGSLVIHATATGADATDIQCQVVAFDPFDAVKLGLTGFPTNFATLSIDSNGRAKAQANYVKNIAIPNYMFFVTDNTSHLPLTGLVDGNFTKKYRLDNGSATSLSGTITEFDSTNFPGWYQIDLTAGEVNGNVVSLRFKTAGSDEVPISIITSR